MRLKIQLPEILDEIKITEIQQKVNSFIHILLGKNNEYHDKFSEYCVSSLMRGVYNKENKTFTYPNGTYIVFSTNNDELISKLTNNIWFTLFDNKYQVNSITPIIESFTTGNNYLTTLTPILLVDNSERNKRTFITINDVISFENELNRRTILKLKKFNENINLKDFKIKILNSEYNKLLPIYVKNVFNLANQVNICISGNKNTIKTIYNLGLGQSTGSGFGTIYNTNQYEIYNETKI